MKDCQVGDTVYFPYLNTALCGELRAVTTSYYNGRPVLVCHVRVTDPKFNVIYEVPVDRLVSKEEAVALTLLEEYA